MKCEICGKTPDKGEFCSEFCAETTQEQKQAFQAMKDGDFGQYPCERCGCIIEDVLSRPAICGSCGPMTRVEALLRETLPHLPPELVEKIRVYFGENQMELETPAMLNTGLWEHRFKDNPEEQRFAEAWNKENSGPFHTLASLLDPYSGTKGRSPEPSPRDRLVAATVIQWLGSPVGQGYLEGLGYERKSGGK